MDWFLSFVVAATIAGQSVSDEQVAHWTEASGGQQQAFNYLVEAVWTEQEARARNVAIADADARAAAEPAHDGLSRADMLYKAKVELLEAGIKEQIATPAARGVTPEQVDAYVEAHPKTLPERRRIRVLKAKTRHRAAQAQSKLAKGLTWRQAARRYGTGGNERLVERGVYDASTERAMFEANRGELERHRRYVFKVTRVLPEYPMPRAQQESQAWEQLSSEAQQRAIEQFTAEYTAKWRSRTSCAPAYVAQPVCAQAPTDQEGA